MRVKNTIKNIKIGLIFTILTLAINFLSRGIFIKCLGDDIAGFNSLILNLIGFLNIAELGVAAAITYSLYKPLNEKNYNKINEIMVLFKHYYKNIAKMVLIMGIILGLVLKYFVKNQIPMSEAYSYYGLFLFNTVISYFFIYKQTLIIADQKQYLIVSVTNTIRIIKILIQIILLKSFPNYFIWILLEIFFNILSLLVISNKANTMYKEIKFESDKNISQIKSENINILNDIKNVFFHKVATFIVYKTDGILISLFLNLKQTAIYANYIMIINGILSLINNIMGSFTASVGNLVAENNNKKSFEIFKRLHLFDYFIATIVSFMLYDIINDFIVLWIGEDYLFDKLTILVLIINIYIQISRGTIDKFKSSYGIFWDTKIPLIEGAINIIISYFLVTKIGIIGLFIGTLISNICVILIWKPYVIYKYGFKINPLEHIKIFLKFNILSISSILIGYTIKMKLINILSLDSSTWNGFIFSTLITSIIISACTISIFALTKEFRANINSIIGNKIYILKNRFISDNT